MRLWGLQHVPFEGAGCLSNIIDSRDNVSLEMVRLFEGQPLPEVEDVEGVVVFGGPMGVCDDKQYPWLIEEQRFLAQVIEQGQPILGICLGAQLLASVLGARVYPNACKEIGWMPVDAVAGSVDQSLPGSFMALHWHGDTFDLPSESQQLARTSWCENQAFVWRNQVIGLQFHLEATLESVSRLVENCADELVEPSETVHQGVRILADTRRYVEVANELAVGVMRALWKGIA